MSERPPAPSAEAQVLIDAVVQQVTVLIAQIATSGGLRAPLAHVANQVFVDLSRELEAQGLGRKVTADMFGMALRAYQRKRKRLVTRSSAREQTLWSSVLEVLERRGPIERKAVLASFATHDERSVRAVLRDLVEAGLVTEEGSGVRARYRRAGTSHDAGGRDAGLDELLCALLHRAGPSTAPAVAERLRLPEAKVSERLGALAQRGRLERREGRYEARDFSVPLGAPAGWEAAVLDHVHAVVRAICQRLQASPSVPSGAERAGGSTYAFDVWDGHPLLAEVEGSLARFRVEHSRLRARVEAHNRVHGRPERYVEVVVYGGQCANERERPKAASRRKPRTKARGRRAT